MKNGQLTIEARGQSAVETRKSDAWIRFFGAVRSMNASDRSITRFIREISTEMSAATAPSRNAGAATLPMTRDNCSIDGVSGSMSNFRF